MSKELNDLMRAAKMEGQEQEYRGRWVKVSVRDASHASCAVVQIGSISCACGRLVLRFNTAGSLDRHFELTEFQSIFFKPSDGWYVAFPQNGEEKVEVDFSSVSGEGDC